MAGGVTQRLAAWASGASYDALPDAVVREAKRSLLNWVGVTLGGCRHPAVETALATISPFAGAAQASLLGRSKRIDAPHAALVNGTASHVLDFDDTHLRTIIHPTGPVAAAILALAEYLTPLQGGSAGRSMKPPGATPSAAPSSATEYAPSRAAAAATGLVSGKAFINALVAGVEVECRIGNAVYPSHYDVGWHITGTAGVFGAAAAAGRLLGLDPQRMTWALGIAATQAAGLREMFGTMCKPFHVGRAAQNGLLAALLAERGFTSSEQSIEAPRGFASVLASARNYAEITDGLGARYEIMQNTYKPFACGIVIHPTIDGCVQLRQEHQLRGDEIEHIDLRVAPLVLELTGKRTPGSGLEGKFSVYHSAAVAIIDGTAREAQYSDVRVADPAVVALRDRVDAVADPSVREDEAYVSLSLKDGRSLQRHVCHAVGSLERPLSDADLDAKFRDLGAPVLPANQIETLIALCRRIETLPDVSYLARAAAGPQAAYDAGATS